MLLRCLLGPTLVCTALTGCSDEQSRIECDRPYATAAYLGRTWIQGGTLALRMDVGGCSLQGAALAESERELRHAASPSDAPWPLRAERSLDYGSDELLLFRIPDDIPVNRDFELGLWSSEQGLTASGLDIAIIEPNEWPVVTPPLLVGARIRSRDDAPNWRLEVEFETEGTSFGDWMLHIWSDNGLVDGWNVMPQDTSRLWGLGAAGEWTTPEELEGKREICVRTELFDPLGALAVTGEIQCTPVVDLVEHSKGCDSTHTGGAFSATFLASLAIARRRRSGRPVSRLTGPPQTRTCGIPSSGSSVHTFATGVRHLRDPNGRR